MSRAGTHDFRQSGVLTSSIRIDNPRNDRTNASAPDRTANRDCCGRNTLLFTCDFKPSIRSGEEALDFAAASRAPTSAAGQHCPSRACRRRAGSGIATGIGAVYFTRRLDLHTIQNLRECGRDHDERGKNKSCDFALRAWLRRHVSIPMAT
jgi:hypothetical protein